MTGVFVGLGVIDAGILSVGVTEGDTGDAVSDTLAPGVAVFDGVGIITIVSVIVGVIVGLAVFDGVIVCVGVIEFVGV